MNLYSDPGLLETYVPFGAGITQSGQSLVFAGALNSSAISLPSGNVDFLDRIASGGLYHISVNVSGYSSGDGRAKLCGGFFAALGITGDGWSAPVPVIAGPSRSLTLGLFGISGGATFDIVPDANNEAVRITT